MVTMATNDTLKNSFVGVYNYDDNSQRHEPPDPDMSVSLTIVVCMLTVFSVVGVVGNAIAFYIFCGRRSTSTSVIFILALAGVDFFTCLVTIPYTIYFEMVKYNLVYDAACKLYMFLITSIQPFSAYIMVGIALDRYFCICHPFLYVFTVPRAKAVVLCMAIPALIFGIITALSFGMNIYEVSSLDTNSSSRVVVSAFTDKGEADRFVAVSNFTNSQLLISYVHYHQCVNNTYIFSKEFLHAYKQFHAMNFVLAYISVAVLYILIYKSIFTRRVKKAKRKKCNLYPASSNKTKENNGEETQMTAINGSNITNQKSLNNQMRKDAKYARKITLTARNDPSVFGHSEPVSKSLSGLSGTGLLAQEISNISPNRNDLLSNGNLNQSLPCLYQSNKSKGYVGKETAPIYRGPVTHEKDDVYVGPVSYENDTVYIGPEANVKDTVYTGPLKHEEDGVCVNRRKCHGDIADPQVGQEKDTVHMDPHLVQEKDSVNRGPQDSQENDSVYTGPKVCRDKDIVYKSSQERQETDTVCTGPQIYEEKDIVYLGPQVYPEKDTVYIGPQENTAVSTTPEAYQKNDIAFPSLQTSRDESGTHTGSKAYQEEIGTYYFPPTDNAIGIVGTELQAASENSSPYTDPWGGQDEQNIYHGQASNKDSNRTSTPPAFSNEGQKTTQLSSSSDATKQTQHTTFDPASDEGDNLPRIEADKNHDGQSKNEFNNISANTSKIYPDKYEVHDNIDDDTNLQGFCADEALPEEKPLLENKLQCPQSSRDRYEATPSKDILSASSDCQVPGEERGRSQSSAKQTPQTDTHANSLKRKRPGTFRDRHLIANIKTAFMLFIVTLVFIIAYLPALLMANDLVPFKIIVFYVYFIYNVANPFIYAFMNHTFREDLKKLIKLCKR